MNTACRTTTSTELVRWLRALTLTVVLGPQASLAEDNIWTGEDLSAIQVETRRLINADEFDEVIRQLTALRGASGLSLRKFAQEYLGVARERKRQYEFARLEYERFLADFGDQPEASRVQMRLDALLESARPERPAEVVSQTGSQNVDGTIRLDYRWGQNKSDSDQPRTSVSLASTDIDLRGSWQGEDSELGSRLSLGHYEDLLTGGGATRDRIRYLYLDYEGTVDIRVGRQRAQRSAVLGRFDGLDIRYELPSGPELAVYLGMPVGTSAADLFSDERRFLGFSAGSGDRWGRFEVRVHGLHQITEGQVDRQSVGTQFRFTGDGMFAQAVVDYDVHFNELNAVLLNVNWSNAHRPNVNFSYDLRKSPTLATRNALIGQETDSIETLLASLVTESDLLELASDRSLTSQFISLGLGVPDVLGGSFSGSINWVTVDEGVASGGITASPRRRQVQLDSRLNLRDVLLDRNDMTFGLRYDTRDNLDAWAIYANSNYRIGQHLRVSPRLQMRWTDYASGNSQKYLYPELRVEYQDGHHLAYLVVGYHRFNNHLLPLGDQLYEMLLTYLGYQYRF